MTNVLFVLVPAAVLALFLAWSFKNLPAEKWQILAAVPVRKASDAQWSGVNLTTYGLINAGAYVTGVATLFILLSAVSVPAVGTLALAVVILSLCMPASRLVARAVEKKAHTFTTGGASFIGLLAAPCAVAILNHTLGRLLDFEIPMLPTLAGFGIAYAFGEGLGRVACISFGCCYGKRCSESPLLIRRIFENRSFVFTGKTKKIAYASGMDGEKVLPVQAITSVLYVGAGLVALVGYMASKFAFAFIFTVAVTQTWRAVSEVFRSDYRGEGKVSAYQFMAGAAVMLAPAFVFLLPEGATGVPDMALGLKAVWKPEMLLFFQALGVWAFLFTGRSRVTGSTLSFHVFPDRV